ncbi:unnamed protein product [Staurois parvus]|uniref:Stathmin n=1 Tax=Staurois parvus TaxID=386267 RepID=A0ABN9FDX6_9NEOB|nr:unnamed protein product [Staurois parvus]
MFPGRRGLSLSWKIAGNTVDSFWVASRFKFSVMADGDIKVKELEKRQSGQAFELLLSPRSTDAAPDLSIASPKKKECSLEEIQKKLEAAEERRLIT